MKHRYALGILTGLLLGTSVRLALTAALAAIVHRVDMAEERTWTGTDDHDLRELLRDLNGQQP